MTTQITNSNCPPCYRRHAVQKFFRWPVNSPDADIAYYSYLPSSPEEFRARHVVYDRTDNWSGLLRRGPGAKGLRDESWLIGRAEIVICSSRWLYSDTLRRQPGKKVFYVPNGSYGFDMDVEKHERKTAVYAGKRIAKVDTGLLAFLAKASPEWDFLVYTESPPPEPSPRNVIWKGWIESPEEIFREVKKCHIGLCTLLSNDYTRGMLPDKVFLYGNAGIPCVYSGIPDINVEEFKWCTRELNLSKVLNTQFSYRKRTWNDVCSEIKEIIADEYGRDSVGQD